MIEQPMRVTEPVRADQLALPRPHALNPWALVPSIALHAVLVLALTFMTLGRPLILAPVRSIEVELIPDMMFEEDAFDLPPDITATPLATPTKTDAPDAVAPAASDQMVEATELFANRVLADPQNREVREALPTLDLSERLIQLCVIEGLEQLNRARPTPFPDSIQAGAFEPTFLSGYTVTAAAGAYRAERRWYRLRFTCTVAPDLSGVQAFQFAMGDPIPEPEWEAHDLIAEDEDE